MDWGKKGIPKDLTDKSLNSLPEEYKLKFSGAYILSQKWRDDHSIEFGLMIKGAIGSGKSSLGSHIIQTLLEKRHLARRVRLIDLLESYYENWKLPESVKQDSTLFIDDIVMAGETWDKKIATAEKILMEVVKYRHEKKLRTMIAIPSNATGNYSDEFRTIMSDYFILVELPVVNLRADMQKKAKENLYGGINFFS